MTEEPIKEKPITTPKDEKELAIAVTATVDPKQLEGLIGQIKDKDTEIEKLKKELETTTTDGKGIKTKLEEAESTAEDFKNKLSIIARQELTTRKSALMEEAKKFITDEDRLKVIEDGIQGPDDLKVTEFLIETIKGTIAEGAKQHETLKVFEERMKTLGAPDTIKTMEELDVWEKENKASGNADPIRKPSSGTLTLAGQTAGGEDGYDSHAIMVRDLRRRSHSANPEEAATAKSVLKELFRKWTVAVKKEYEGQSRGVKIEKGKEQASLRDITKLGGAVREDESQEGA